VPTPTSSTPAPSPLRWRALVALAAAQFLVIMDTSIIGVALPDMQASLGFDPDDLSWVFNAYVIAFGGLLLLGGKLSDILGARRVFTAGFWTLTIASIAAGQAQSPGVEIVARAAQGVVAALIAPASLTLLMTLFGHNPRELAKALAIYAAAAPAGGTAGVFLGGVLTEWLDWPWVFYINVPIGIAVLAVTPRLLPRTERVPGRIDVLGGLTITAALTLGVLAIVRAPEIGWASSETLTSAVIAGALLLGFIAMQARRSDPLVPLGIFRVPGLAVSNVVMALLGAAWVPMWFFLNLYLQQVLDFGPFAAGASLLPMTILMMVLMVGVTGRLVGRSAPKPVLVSGLAVLSVGLGILTSVSADGSFVGDVLAGSLVAAVGMSLAYIPAMMSALAGASPANAGLASGIVNSTYQVGSALGLAVMTAVATSAGADQLGDPGALTDGYAAAFAGAAAIAAVAAIVAATGLQRNRPLSEAQPELTTVA
jgi:EmrB/QacA subfamily drug resistance transporter